MRILANSYRTCGAIEIASDPFPPSRTEIAAIGWLRTAWYLLLDWIRDADPSNDLNEYEEMLLFLQLLDATTAGRFTESRFHGDKERTRRIEFSRATAGNLFAAVTGRNSEGTLADAAVPPQDLEPPAAQTLFVIWSRMQGRLLFVKHARSKGSEETCWPVI